MPCPSPCLLSKRHMRFCPVTGEDFQLLLTVSVRCPHCKVTAFPLRLVSCIEILRKCRYLRLIKY